MILMYTPVHPRGRGEHSYSIYLKFQPNFGNKSSTNFSKPFSAAISILLMIIPGQERHQSKAIKVYRYTPVFTDGGKFISGFGTCAPNHDGIAFFHAVANQIGRASWREGM